MRARDIVGKTIASVKQHRFQHSSGRWGWSIGEIVCTDGTIIRPYAMESECGDDYGIDLVTIKPRKGVPIENS